MEKSGSIGNASDLYWRVPSSNLVQDMDHPEIFRAFSHSLKKYRLKTGHDCLLPYPPFPIHYYLIINCYTI
jgi:hypothetical protein